MVKIPFVISPSQQDGNPTVVKEAPRESDLTRIVANALYEILKHDERLDVVVVPDYEEGTDIQKLRKAIDFSNKFISERNEGGRIKGFHLELHTDGGYSGSGATGLYLSENGYNFGKPIYDELCTLTPWHDMAFKKADNLMALSQTIGVAYIQEISFHDKTEEAYWIFNNVPNIAEAIARGIYKGIGLTRNTAPTWQVEALSNMSKNAVINSPEYWVTLLDRPATVGQVMAIAWAVVKYFLARGG